ncbi:MAG: L-threonylcarbamoyladenylate synthase [Ginsengibacter sp.]
MQKIRMGEFTNDIENCLKILNTGGIILYPTDTVWGIGCDATNQQAVEKIFALKQRKDSKAMIILISEQMDIGRYVKAPDDKILNYVSQTSQPVTAVYENGINVAHSLISEDGTIAIRITIDEFCTALLNKFNKSLVSTSANISGKPAPAIFKDISVEIKNGVDYIVQHRQSDFRVAKASAIIRLNKEKEIVVLRS